MQDISVQQSWLRSVIKQEKSKETIKLETMAKKKSNPIATVTGNATCRQGNPGVTTELDTLIDPSGAPDEMFDAMVPIVHSLIIAFIIKLCQFPEESTMVDDIDHQGWTDLIHVTTI
jgi:hypothetical protein